MRPDDVIPTGTDFSELDVQGLKDWLGHFETFDIFFIDEKCFYLQTSFGNGSTKVGQNRFEGE